MMAQDDAELVYSLILRGADVNRAERRDHHTPLLMAVHLAKVDLLGYVLSCPS